MKISGPWSYSVPLLPLISSCLKDELVNCYCEWLHLSLCLKCIVVYLKWIFYFFFECSELLRDLVSEHFVLVYWSYCITHLETWFPCNLVLGYVSDSVVIYITSVGFVGGQWIVGVIDEVRKASTEDSSSDTGPLLSDTKTRVRDTLPAEPQRRNGR